MKVVEILKLGRIWLELLQKSCIKVDDVRFLSLYDDYKRHVKGGEKVSYVARLLSEKYDVSERQVYYIIKKLNKDCNLSAME